MPLGHRLVTGWIVLAIALWLPVAACGQAPATLQPVPQDAAPVGSAPFDAAANVCPQCGQPPTEPPAAAPGGGLIPSLFSNIFNHPPWERAGGPSEPVWRESWVFEPFSVGLFIGVADAFTTDNPTHKDITPGLIGGFRAGWDLNHYWGTETRMAWSTGKFTDQLLGGSIDCRTNTLFWDLDLLYYPWGDSRWRPYFLTGLGATQVRYLDEGRSYGNTGSIPLAVGLKYRWNERFALRLEFGDDIAFPIHPDNIMHSLSLTTGLEFRFGGTRKSYWPYNPGLFYW